MQGYDAKACRRLQSAHPHACAGPNFAALRIHPDRCDAYQASFAYPTPMLVPKSASFPYLTPMLVPKSASFTQLTRLHAPKRGVFGKVVYQSVLIYAVYRIHTIKSNQIYGV